jgi:hypothetical protein
MSKLKLIVDKEEEQLNIEGLDGWELIAFMKKYDAMRKEDIYFAIMKRSVEQ